MEEPGRLQSVGSLRVRNNWATSLSLFIFMHWRRKWQPTPVFLPGESQGRESLVGCRLWDSVAQSRKRQKRLSSSSSSSASVQFRSVAQSCPTLCDPMNCSMPGFPVHDHLPEFTQTHVHRVCDAIQPSHPRLSPSPPAPNPSQHQSSTVSQLFTWDGQSIGDSALASFLPKKSLG